MSILGRVGVDVQFQDKEPGTAVSSTKTIALQHATEYDFGKVAVVTGTVGTATVTLPISPTTYRDAAGSVVSFASISRVAFAATGANIVACDGSGGCGVNDWTIYSRAGQIAVSEAVETSSFVVNVVGTAGTSSYTLVLYGT
jgi:hypothetical protein